MLPARDARSARYGSLHTKYHELREQFTTLRNLYYLIECAWCKQRLGWKRKTAAVPGDTSHSICPPCAADLLRGLAHLQALLLGMYATLPEEYLWLDLLQASTM